MSKDLPRHQDYPLDANDGILNSKRKEAFDDFLIATHPVLFALDAPIAAFKTLRHISLAQVATHLVVNVDPKVTRHQT